MRSGGAEEQGASRQGDSPCTRPAKKKTVFSSGFPHVAWGTVRQGPVRPPYPRQQGHRPCTLPAMEETYRTYFFPHETSGNGMSAHGRNENVEKSRSGKCTFLPVFSRFPRMPCIRLAAILLPPARVRTPVAHPTRKETIFLCKSMCACYAVSSGNCLCDKISNIRKWVQG